MLPTDVVPFVKIAVALFVLVNPLEGVPVFMAHSRHLDAAGRRRTAHTAAIAVTVWRMMCIDRSSHLLVILGPHAFCRPRNWVGPYTMPDAHAGFGLVNFAL